MCTRTALTIPHSPLRALGGWTRKSNLTTRNNYLILVGYPARRTRRITAAGAAVAEAKAITNALSTQPARFLRLREAITLKASTASAKAMAK
ncbi:hypothetical protein SSBR45G_03510 [Bradyrhizobium sp. SSBR45G]|nr:hypothetical protein SSBR45G_03510 [Bradyrhizobium sp. SSBR45G]GLH82770.1 hypothetical protein SSBR45R_02300 [Bradyrhizobium sp. SSBR45R]